MSSTQLQNKILLSTISYIERIYIYKNIFSNCKSKCNAVIQKFFQ